jgi:ATP-dependent Lhr-like helicase
VLRHERLEATQIIVSRGGEGDPRVPTYAGSRMPLTTYLAARVRGILAEPARWDGLPDPVREWLRLQALRSALPGADGLLVETFPRGGRWFLVAYCFEGRLAHQSLGMLVTKRMERAGYGPLGYLGTDYVLACWSAFEPTDVALLFDEEMLGEDLEEWMADSSMLRRSFRNIAVVAQIIERNHPGQEKAARSMTMNADLIYDVLRRHEPDHVLLRATRAEAAGGLTDIARIGALLARARGRIRHMRLSRVSPLAVPALVEEGREWVPGGARDALLAEAAALVADATDGAEAFDEALDEALADVTIRAQMDRPRHRVVEARKARRSRYVRNAPRSASPRA